MKRLIIIPFSLALALSIFLFFRVGPVAANSEREIFQWVQKEMGADSSYTMPEFRFVSKERLQELFRKDNERSFQKWADQMGNNQAQKMMKMYLTELIGLYSPATGEVYVGKFLDPCRKEAVLAHEFAHHIQVMEEGDIDVTLYNAEYEIMFREMQAKSIEMKYLETFCPGP